MANTRFLDPEQVLFRSGLNRGNTVVDLGAGSGYFAIAAAKIAGEVGKIHVIDIQDSALDHVMAEARLKNYGNIQTYKHDLESEKVLELPSGSADMVIVSNILHLLQQSNHLFTESYRLIKTGGKLLVLDWNSNSSPFGPKSDQRISEEQVKAAAAKANFKFKTEVEADQYHFGLIFTK